MEDGIRLATDIYRPVSAGKYPVIIARTPYGKSGDIHPYKKFAELFASRGYVVIIQDVRGKYDSEGEFFPYANEALDGHHTVTWAGEASWSNGKVAVVGLSYLGSCAWLAARYKSPYLRAIVPMFTSHDTYSIWLHQGIPYLKGPVWWLSTFSAKTENKTITHENLESILKLLPVNEMDLLTVNHRIPFFREYLTHHSRDQFWDHLSLNKYIDEIDVPALIIGGWYDPFLSGTFDDYQRMIHSKPNSKNSQSELLIGPWGHNPAQKFTGISFGEKASASIVLEATLNWCDRWLKESKSTPNNNKICYFIMGKNEWKDSEEWPSKNVSYEKYYLAKRDIGVYRKNGLLSKIPYPQLHATLYLYNPLDPVLFRGSYLLHSEGWITPIDQNEVMTREDVLIYTSEPMEEDLVIAGDVKLIFYVSSDALDTDFCVKISDFHPNGKIYNLTTGFMRMRFRDSLTDPSLMEPGTIYKVEITFRPLATAFLKNHRIQLQITSSDFPVHDRNLNTGMNNEYTAQIKTAEQTVYAGGECDSHLILPVLYDA